MPALIMSDKAILPDIYGSKKVRRFVRNIVSQSAVSGYAPDMEWPDLTLADGIETLPILPGWGTSGRG